MTTLYYWNGLLGKFTVYTRTDDKSEINHLKSRFPKLHKIPTDTEFLVLEGSQ